MDIIVKYVIRRLGKKEYLHLKSVTIINTVKGWFEIAQYNDNIVISIAKLVQNTWLSRNPRPIEIMYDHVSAFIGNEFRKQPIETEYGIIAKPSTVGNPMSNVVSEQIHQVLGNLV